MSSRDPNDPTVGLGTTHASQTRTLETVDRGPLSVGERLLDRFQILRFVAGGGMGAVYEARDEVLGGRIALKVIREDGLQDGFALERFRREVVLARRVSHPNVCRVHEFFDATGAGGNPVRFLTMEFLEGETLADRIRRQGRLSTEEALPLVRHICAGLEALEAVGIVHRDLKSSNILLAPDPAQGSGATRAVITDFGIAWGVLVDQAQPPQQPLTDSMPLIGTPAYMSPEQLSGDPLTAASDIYSLGVVMYEMVVGDLPFSGPNPLALALRRIREPVPRPEMMLPGLDPRWAETIRRCLQIDPRARFHRPSEIVPALEAKARRPVWRRPLLLTSLLVLAVALLAGGTAATRRLAARSGPRPTTGPGERARNLALHPRSLLAVVGLASSGPAELSWVGAGVSHLLADQLEESAGEIRVVPWHRVALARSSLGIPLNTAPSEGDTDRLMDLLSIPQIILGTCTCGPAPHSSCEARVRLVERHGGTAVELAERFPPEATASAAARLGEKLRAHLGVVMSPEERASLSARIPSHPELIRLYAEAMLAFERHDLNRALEYLDAAVGTDPLDYDAQSARSLMLQRLGLFSRAAEAADTTRRAAARLSSAHRAEADARLTWLSAPLEQALSSFQTLSAEYPDDVDLALELGARLPPKAALVLVTRLRRLPSPAARDLRIDLLEAGMKIRLEPGPVTDQQLDSVGTKARALGARRELSAVRELQYHRHLLAAETDKALQALEEARGLSRDAGDLARAARLMSAQATDYQLVNSKRSVALRVEASSILRGLSDRMGLHELVVGQVFDEFRRGSIPVARERWAEAKEELVAAGEPVTPYTWFAAAWLEIFAGNAIRARELYSQARQTRPRNLWVTTSDLFSALSSYDDPILFDEHYLGRLELSLLLLEDRLDEARSLALAQKARAEEANQVRETALLDRPLCAVDCENQGGFSSAHCAEVLHFFPNDECQCFLAAGEPEAAARAAQRGLQTEPTDPILRAVLAAAEALLRQPGRLAELESLSAELRERGAIGPALRVELLLGRVELRLHRASAARRLKVVAEEARAGGFIRLARRAEEAAASQGGRRAESQRF